MRTKILLLSAATVVAGMLSAQAQQNVYSVNVVGYVNVATTVPNQFALWSNPLSNGTNTITSLFPTAPNGTTIQIWNGSSFQSASKSFGNWNTNLLLSPGVGFFIKYPVSAGLVTNTFVGQVVTEQVNSAGGGTNATALPNVYALVGSKFPFAGNLTASGPNTLNLGSSMGNGSTILVWQGTSYQSASKSFGNWNTNLNLTVGQGYFVKANVPTNWVQVLTY